MGGLGSGRHSERHTVERSLLLDVKDLIQNGSLVPGSHVNGRLEWYRRGQLVLSAAYEASLILPEDSWIHLSYLRGGKRLETKIYLALTQPHFGGARWWFVCPEENEHVAKLYLPPDGEQFVSRQAGQLCYASQRETKFLRTRRKVMRLRKYLSDKSLPGSGTPTKPKWMHLNKYQSLLFRLHNAERQYVMLLGQGL